MEIDKDSQSKEETLEVIEPIEEKSLKVKYTVLMRQHLSLGDEYRLLSKKYKKLLKEHK